MIKKGIICASAFLIRVLLSLRYKWKIEGLLSVQEKRDPKRGIVFLPNHPAEIDPVILETLLYGPFQTRPLVVDRFYHLKGFGWLMRLIGALPLPDMDEKSSRFRLKRIEQNFNQVISVLEKGGSILLYPSGRLKRSGLEQLGGASLAHRLWETCIEKNIEIDVVLVRTQGLWGSQFSRALTGISPPFGKSLKKGLAVLCKNGFLFTPRRNITIEFLLATTLLPQQGSRLEFNHFLEKWYNAPFNEKGEPLSLVSYAFWKKDYPLLEQISRQEDKHYSSIISPEIVKKITSFLAKLAHLPEEEITKKKELSQDLGLDSLDLIQVYLFLDENYGVTDLPTGTLTSVEDVMQAAAGHGGYQRKEEEKQTPFVWPREKTRQDGKIPDEARSIVEAFLLQAEARKKEVACVEAETGVLMTYRQMKRRVLLLARYFARFPEEKVGVMLPSSSVTYLVILALMLARKIPVMINWTVGEKAIDHAVNLFSLQRVLTSLRFLEKLSFDTLGKIEDRFFLLEEVKETLSYKEVIHSFLDSFRSKESLLQGVSSTAVVLFTSGTEALPKAVPLSHENILANLRAASSVISFSKDTILYGVLPPFHSFGFSPTGLFPLLAGIRAIYSPDPTDSHRMAREIAIYKPTLFCAAPSFIVALMQAAKKGELDSLQLLVSGAEKTPQHLFDCLTEKCPHAHLLEGYGITECSPIVSLDRLGEAHQGVGRPLPGVEILICEEENEVECGREGEIYIGGEGVFAGYYGETKQPFRIVKGRSFFVSGDRGKIDNEGHLILTGRSKRFVKIGGEMIGLSGIEEQLRESFGKEQTEGPFLALIVRQEEGNKPELVVVTTLSIDKEEMNQKLREKGFSRLVKIGAVYRKETIPLLSTGKVNYRALAEDIGK